MAHYVDFKLKFLPVRLLVSDGPAEDGWLRWIPGLQGAETRQCM